MKVSNNRHDPNSNNSNLALSAGYGMHKVNGRSFDKKELPFVFLPCVHLQIICHIQPRFVRSALSVNTEGSDYQRQYIFGFLNLLFEEVSAFGTVGLSTGITSGLSDAGKMIIITSMYVGRIGTLTLAMALTKKAFYTNYRYSKANIIVGWNKKGATRAPFFLLCFLINQFSSIVTGVDILPLNYTILGMYNKFNR